MPETRPTVIVLTTSFPAGVAGADAAGSFVSDFCELLERQVQVIVVAPGEAEERAEGELQVLRFAAPSGKPLSTLSVSSLADIYWITKVLWAGWRETARAVKLSQARHSPVLVFALWAVPCGLWARLAGWRYAVPYATWSLGSDVWSFMHKPLLRRVLKFALVGATHRYADGLVLADDVEEVSGLGCEFMASSRRLPEQAPKFERETGGGRSVRFLGRWHPNKGVDLLLDALDLLSDDDWARIDEVVIAGGGVLESRVRQAAATLAAAGRPIRIEGYLGREAAAKFIAAADFLILPSRVESIPVILSDALNCKTTLVMTPVGDLPELHRRYGYGVLLEEISAEAIARGLGSALCRVPGEFYGRGDELAESLSLDTSVRRLLGDIGFQLGSAPGKSQRRQSAQ